MVRLPGMTPAPPQSSDPSSTRQTVSSTH
jgi:hypothetical protein